MNVKIWIVAAAGILATGPVLAGSVKSVPGPEIGVSTPGLLVGVALIAGYFAIRWFRKQA